MPGTLESGRNEFGSSDGHARPQHGRAHRAPAAGGSPGRGLRGALRRFPEVSRPDRSRRMARIPPVRVRDEASASLLGRLRHPSRPHGSLPGALDHFRGGLGRRRERTRENIIALSTPLSLASSFRFPLPSAESRRETAWGALLLVLLPGIGWFLNMGHRIVVVHRMQHGEPPWPAWKNYPQLLGHGLITFGGMLYYSAPGLALAYFSWALRSRAAAVAAAGLLVAATLAIPGYMAHYCRELDPAEIYDPLRALRRGIQGATGYWHAWLITLCALVVSLSGLLTLGA